MVPHKVLIEGIEPLHLKRARHAARLSIRWPLICVIPYMRLLTWFFSIHVEDHCLHVELFFDQNFYANTA